MIINKATRGMLLLFITFFLGSGCIKIDVTVPNDSINNPPEDEICELEPFDEQVEVVHKIDVTKYFDSEISIEDAKTILTQAENVAREGNKNPMAGGDVACNIRFEVKATSETLGTFGTLGNPLLSTPAALALDCLGNGEICSEFDFYAVAANNSSEVKVVNDIRWCNFPRAGVAGCTDKNFSMVVRRMCEEPDQCPVLEGISWLHEFGHLQGLYHRRDDSEPAVMKDTFTSHDVGLNACECLKYRKSREF